jgi:hypothetical protein
VTGRILSFESRSNPELMQQATTASIADCTNPLAREGSELGLKRLLFERIAVRQENL